MFNEESIVVQTWVKAVRSGEKLLADVPNLSNLIEVVTQIVEGDETNV
jgi:hypothetical protein